MQLVPTIKDRERILLYGPSSSGKSTAVLNIARRIAPNHMHIVDNDDTYSRLQETEFTDVDNITVYDVDKTDWEEQLKIAKESRRAAQRNDFWVYDMTGPLWEATQSWFTQKLYGIDHADYFLELRLQDDRAVGDSGKGHTPVVRRQTDDRWTVINGQYNKFNQIILGNDLGLDKDTKSHVICCAESAKLENEDPRELKTIFGDVRLKPRGNKWQMHHYHTIILMEQARVDEWTMTSVKDRGREKMDQVEVKDFAMDYLFKRAKWKPTTVS